ncbi:MAG: hypothetical protein P8127_11080 [Acidobacteriota bacterium]
MLMHLDLAAMTDRADRIFRGTVVDVEQSSIEAGGGELPMVIYRLKVEDSLKGEADVVKGDEAYVEIHMVGSIKDEALQGDLVHFDMFRDVPRLRMGSDYLLFTTPPSAIGLSTTVGLGQGAFSVYSQDKQDWAVNQFDNAGLGIGGGGAVAYSDLVAEIKARMGE